MKIYSISKLPTEAAVYAMLGGSRRKPYVAYIGIAGNLRSRINQHLVLRDSSISTGVSAVHLNADYVAEVRFWILPEFSDVAVREAAELVAFDVLNPALRSRGAITERAKNLLKDNDFSEKMHKTFQADPTGQLIILTLQDSLEKIEELEKRISELEKKINLSI